MIWQKCKEEQIKSQTEFTVRLVDQRQALEWRKIAPGRFFVFKFFKYMKNCIFNNFVL